MGPGPDVVIWPYKYFDEAELQILQWWSTAELNFHDLNLAWPAKHLKFITGQKLDWHGIRAGRARMVWFSTPIKHRVSVTKNLGRWSSEKTMKHYVGARV